ncbi:MULTISPECIES: nitrite reductase small subunit NirD [unclassified Oceanobacter]|uniref:nitrite reductase small subunit NirD n=1 Tax=unclassified Oceanobacter TaxID=2620260 RepID=UPI002735CDA0|nr:MULTISPECIES: nitrite reductase small subunit NirD [unclassified Oceanobacter]MDP2507290.1 nitrite reductase small subunit NirD [Oceanobacter sp. 3_MG-2023]MDP2548435.1 nitrite reductase small subunit NirD [Oceanobacter sp. 4_MG-2023]
MTQWTQICALTDIAPDTGVCALHQGEQVALFRLGQTEQVFAIGNYDPIGRANVLSRGIVGSIGERYVVASPLYKQHFDLATGECLEDDAVTVKAYPVRIAAGQVELAQGASLSV